MAPAERLYLRLSSALVMVPESSSVITLRLKDASYWKEAPGFPFLIVYMVNAICVSTYFRTRHLSFQKRLFMYKYSS